MLGTVIWPKRKSTTALLLQQDLSETKLKNAEPFPAAPGPAKFRAYAESLRLSQGGCLIIAEHAKLLKDFLLTTSL